MPTTFSDIALETMSNPLEICTANDHPWSVLCVNEKEHPHHIVLTRGWQNFYEHYHLQSQIHATIFVSLTKISIYGPSIAAISTKSTMVDNPN
ncbi:hypothetical protein AHAS_Ahas14G0158800 [Arachis hypogaea]